MVRIEVNVVTGEVIEIEQQFYQSPDGKVIVLDATDEAPENYVPVTVEQVDQIRAAANTPTHAELVERTKAKARSMRLPIISILDGMQASSLANEDKQAAQMIENVKVALRNITSIDLSACTTEQEMQYTIYAAYIQIRAAAPEFVQTAFAQLVEA